MKSKKWIIEKAIRINSYIKRERINSSMMLIEKAKQYIKKITVIMMFQ